MRRAFNKLKCGTFNSQGKRRYPLLRVIFAQTLLLLVTSVSGNLGKVEAAAAGPGVVLDAAQTYRDFLSNPPWLKKIEFRLDRNYRVDVTDESHPQREAGTGTYVAAWQPGGYYRKHLAGSPLYDNPPGQLPRSRTVLAGRENISGASDRFYWRLWEGQDEISLVPKDDQSGASADNWLRGFFDFELADLAKIRRLGLDQLVDARIMWVDKDHFTAETSDRGPAHGTIVQYTNGLPATVEYSFDSAASNIFRVRYAYASGQLFPPHQITVEETVADGNRITHVNYLDALDVGLDPDAAAGYRPEAFRVSAKPFKQISLSSNGILYHVDQRGQLNAVDTQYPGLERFSQPKSRPTLVGLIMIAPSLAFFLYFVLARRRAKRQNDINPNQTNLC